MEPKVLVTIVLLAISGSRAFYLDPFGGFGGGFGGGFNGFGGYGGFGHGLGFGGYGHPAPLIAPVPVHHHTVQQVVQPIIIQPPEEEEPEPEPKVEVHVHAAEPHPPEPHHAPPPPAPHIIHV